MTTETNDLQTQAEIAALRAADTLGNANPYASGLNDGAKAAIADLVTEFGDAAPGIVGNALRSWRGWVLGLERYGAGSGLEGSVVSLQALADRLHAVRQYATSRNLVG